MGVRGRCLGAVGFQFSRGCEKCEVNTSGNDVVAACLTPVKNNQIIKVIKSRRWNHNFPGIGRHEITINLIIIFSERVKSLQSFEAVKAPKAKKSLKFVKAFLFSFFVNFTFSSRTLML